eukprot:gb/GEZN01000734.1/.p1 GENE.gb/GEZN01000734.1/~~gb/GEZN01000734.1/.p1  ORF type:complete len:1125 (+),score=82.12 gb/GEZN01000734.1/:66-3440(+)
MQSRSLFFLALVGLGWAQDPLSASVYVSGFQTKQSSGGLKATPISKRDAQVWTQISPTEFDIAGDPYDTLWIALEFSSLPRVFSYKISDISAFTFAGRLSSQQTTSDDPNSPKYKPKTDIAMSNVTIIFSSGKAVQHHGITSTPPVVAAAIRLTIDVQEPFRLDNIKMGSSTKTSEWRPANSQTEAICSVDNSLNVACWDKSTDIYKKSLPVARLLINNNFLCTGFLIHSKNILITNYHCFSDQTAVDATTFEFKSEAAACEDTNGQLMYRGVSVLTGGTYMGGEKALDYALVQLNQDVASIYGIMDLDFNSNSAKAGTKIFIPQYPRGWAKMIAYYDDDKSETVLSEAQSPCLGGKSKDLGYMGDTDGGSSGAPVVSRSNNKVVGLHHCGGCPNRAIPMTDLQSILSPILASQCFKASDCGKGGNCSWTKLSDVGVCDINACSTNPCLNGGSCIKQGQSFQCDCSATAGYTGTTCQTKIDMCKNFPCKNGGSCKDVGTTYSCTCAAGYEGTDCSSLKNNCVGSSCMNGGTCINGVNKFNCSCVTGFTGRLCETNVDDCALSPCRNGGTCTDGIATRTCACVAGWEGEVCQTNTDDCKSNPCKNGVCQDLVNGFKCLCYNGFDGNTCNNDIDECSTKPCRNGGTCTDKTNGYACTCASGWAGGNCEQDINPCTSKGVNPCSNNGKCIYQETGQFSCQCASGFQGITCGQSASTSTNAVITGGCSSASWIEMIQTGFCQAKSGCDTISSSDECANALSRCTNCGMKEPRLPMGTAQSSGSPDTCYFRPDFGTLWWKIAPNAPTVAANADRSLLCQCCTTTTTTTSAPVTKTTTTTSPTSNASATGTKTSLVLTSGRCAVPAPNPNACSIFAQEHGMAVVSRRTVDTTGLPVGCYVRGGQLLVFNFATQGVECSEERVCLCGGEQSSASVTTTTTTVPVTPVNEPPSPLRTSSLCPALLPSIVACDSVALILKQAGIFPLPRPAIPIWVTNYPAGCWYDFVLDNLVFNNNYGSQAPCSEGYACLCLLVNAPAATALPTGLTQGSGLVLDGICSAWITHPDVCAKAAAASGVPLVIPAGAQFPVAQFVISMYYPPGCIIRDEYLYFNDYFGGADQPSCSASAQCLCA